MNFTWCQFLRSFFPRVNKWGKSNKALQGQTKAFLNPSMFLKLYVTGLRRTLTCSVLCVLSGFARWSTRHSSRSVLIFMKPKRRCTSIVSTVPLLIGGEENVGNKLSSWSRRLTATWTIIVHYALPLEGFCTNPLVIVRELPKLITDQIHPWPW